MKFKVILASAICVLLFVTILLGSKNQNKNENNVYDLVLNTNTQNDYVNVIYFHGTKRCPTCVRLEEFTKDVIENDFEKEIKTGKVKFQTINFDENDNKHYLTEYKLYTNALIIAKFKNGKQTEWKNAQDIWKFGKNKKRFDEYVIAEIKKYLD